MPAFLKNAHLATHKAMTPIFIKQKLSPALLFGHLCKQQQGIKHLIHTMVWPVLGLIKCIAMAMLFIGTHLQATPNFDLASESIRPQLYQAKSLAIENPQLALEMATSILQASPKSKNIEDKVYAYIVMGQIMKAQKKPKKAGEYYIKGYELYKEHLHHTKDPNLLLFLSDGQRVLGKYQVAHELLSKGVNLHRLTPNAEYLMRAYDLQSNLYQLQKKYSHSISSSQESLIYALKLSSQEFILRAYRKIAQASKKNYDYNTSIEYNKKSLAIVQKTQKDKDIARYLGYISMDQRALSLYIPALKNAKKALAVEREYKDTYRISNLLLNVSIIYLKLNNYEQAFEYGSELLKIHEKTGNTNRIASAANQLGSIKYRLKEYDRAIPYFERTLSLKRNTLKKKYVASALKSLSFIHRNTQNFSLANSYAEQAKELYRKANNLSGIASADRAIASIQKEMGNNLKAIQYHKNALHTYQKLKNHWSEADTYLHIGKILSGINETQARENLHKSLKIAKSLQAESLQLKVYRSLISLERSKGNLNTALDITDAAYALMQKIGSKEIRDQITELKIIEETDVKERQIAKLKRTSTLNELAMVKSKAQLEILNQEKTISQLKVKEERFKYILSMGLTLLIAIVLAFVYMRYRYLRENQKTLREHNREIESKNASLEELNITKDRFFSIISHDLRSPISLIVAVSDMLNEKGHTFDKLQIQQHMGVIHDASNKTFGLLENLLSWAVLQLRNTDPTPCTLKAKSLCDAAILQLSTEAQTKDIEVKNTVKACDILYADTNMITTVLRNLIGNAIKFTPKHGAICIYSHTQKDKITIYIKDSGVGINQQDQQNLFEFKEIISRKGTNGEAGTGFGLALCKDLIKKNQGDLGVTSDTEKGSTFYFTLPIRHVKK